MVCSARVIEGTVCTHAYETCCRVYLLQNPPLRIRRAFFEHTPGLMGLNLRLDNQKVRKETCINHKSPLRNNRIIINIEYCTAMHTAAYVILVMRLMDAYNVTIIAHRTFLAVSFDQYAAQRTVRFSSSMYKNTDASKVSTEPREVVSFRVCGQPQTVVFTGMRTSLTLPKEEDISDQRDSNFSALPLRHNTLTNNKRLDAW